VDAQGRGGAGDVDPADQWVFNPETGGYELRLTGDEQPGRPGGDTARHTPPRQRRAPSTEGGDRRPPSAGDRPLPAQRDRRAPRGRRKAAKRKGGRARRVLMWTGGSLAMLLIVGCAGAWYLYQRLNGNLTTVDTGITNEYGDGDPVNLLFIGTDDRTGEGNTEYGNQGDSGRADTTILMHFSADREHATGLSIPRDLVTDIPDCEVKQEDGSTTVIPGSENVRFNESLNVDGRDIGCVQRTVQELTGVEINHVIMADFNAVKELSTAVGGVEVCLEEPINDPKSHLNLPAGRQRIEGEDALAFVRTRYSVGNGGDLDRIQLQQQFLSSMAREITQGGILSSPTRMWDLADIATSSLTVDSGIGTVRKLYDLARDLGRVPMSDMNFVTLPVVDNPDDPEGTHVTVVVDPARAEPVLRMIQEDVSPEEAEQARESEDAANGEGGATEQAEAVPASEVRVDVYNGGSVVGAAQQTLEWLQNQEGMTLATNAGNAAEPQETTTLEFGADQAGQAATLAEIMGLPDSALKQQEGNAGDTPMVLVLGDDFRGAGQPIEVAPELPEDVDSIQADDESVCAS
jgi:LCP family protein required for cell wall assembly